MNTYPAAQLSEHCWWTLLVHTRSWYFHVLLQMKYHFIVELKCFEYCIWFSQTSGYVYFFKHNSFICYQKYDKKDNFECSYQYYFVVVQQLSSIMLEMAISFSPYLTIILCTHLSWKISYARSILISEKVK